jgi:predicted transcriptional regulator
MAETKHMGYTTALKLLQIMTTKGLVTRNEQLRAHVYEARQPAEKTKRQLVGDLLQKVFAGSASQLMMHALSGKKTSRADIDEIRQFLDECERSAK